MTNTAVVLQARFDSRRLPGKVLARLDRRTMLEHCVRRLAIGGLPVIVATTALASDDAVAEEARRLDVDVFRGETDDVLARFVGTARAFGLTTIVRATADNPFVDGQSICRILPVLQRSGADHVIEIGLPVGAAVEAVTAAALARAQELITDGADREHVTSFVRRDTRFRAIRLVAPREARWPGLRLTVDTAEDLDYARTLAAEFDEPALTTPNLEAIIRMAQRVPGQATPALVRTHAGRGA